MEGLANFYLRIATHQDIVSRQRIQCNSNTLSVTIYDDEINLDGDVSVAEHWPFPASGCSGFWLELINWLLVALDEKKEGDLVLLGFYDSWCTCTVVCDIQCHSCQVCLHAAAGSQ